MPDPWKRKGLIGNAAPQKVAEAGRRGPKVSLPSAGAAPKGNKQMAELTRRFPERFVGGKWTYRTEVFEVCVMAISGRYAMVRRPGCTPFVAEKNGLNFIRKGANA